MGDVLEGLLEELLTGVADDIAELLVDAQPSAVEPDVRNPHRGLLEGRAEPIFSLSCRVLLALALGDVPENAQDARGIPVLVLDRRLHGVDKPFLALVQVGLLDLLYLPSRHDPPVVGSVLLGQLSGKEVEIRLAPKLV